MIGLTSSGVIVLNSPGAVSLPVTAPSSLFSMCIVERSSIDGEYLWRAQRPYLQHQMWRPNSESGKWMTVRKRVERLGGERDLIWNDFND